jgi:hypothetical protein
MIIGIITDPAVGGTFLTWSLHYLSGHDESFHWRDNKYTPLIDNPVTKLNAHGFYANQPSTLTESIDCFDQLSNTPTNLFHTIYLHNFKNNLVFDTDTADTKAGITKLQLIADRIILLYNSHPLYHTKFEVRVLAYKLSRPAEINIDANGSWQDFIDTFFNKSKLEWERLGLTNTWDNREFLALNLRPFSTILVTPNVDLNKKHYALDCFELFNNFDKTVVSLFDFLEVTIDSSRWEQWLTVYNQWSKLHIDRILFAEYFDEIIDSIINNHYMELSRFKLDIVREAAIQHVLIYKHGLTFKTQGLEKFPNNTQELHKLLEPNTFHDVEDIYGLLKKESI